MLMQTEARAEATVLKHAQQGSRSDLTNDKNNNSFFFYRLPQYPQDCVSVRDECSLSNSSGVYLIKPDGYSEPFEVYCENEDNLGGWTVVLRRFDGSLSFNRNWEEYKSGFGFFHTEFWLGNDKLAFLTNQAVYGLRIDMVIANGTSLYASFATFRISDEWSQYKLVLVGGYDGNINWSADLPCPPNMDLGSCSCQPSCDDPTGVSNCQDNCDGQDEVCKCSSGLLLKDGQCVLPSDCGCFETETDSVLLAGETHVNVDCTEKCTCGSGRLVCDPNYRCSPNATCGVEDGVRQCYCNDGFGGDGETCTVVHKDCYDAYQDGNTEDGIYPVLPTGWPGSPFNVFCDMSTAGGGWTLFQRRIDGVTDFYRDWDDYKYGFGFLETGRDFWLGNEQLYYLTNQKDYKLRVDIVTSDSSPKHAEYTSFQIGLEYSKYRLNIGTYSGDAGNGMQSGNGGAFSTRDEDNDACSLHDCAKEHRGAWWYSFCTECSYNSLFCDVFPTTNCQTRCAASNLNGNYNGDAGQNINWWFNNRCDLFSAEMKIRPIS